MSAVAFIMITFVLTTFILEGIEKLPYKRFIRVNVLLNNM
jgi:hypothetical protein